MKKIIHKLLASCLWVIATAVTLMAQAPQQYLNAVSGQMLEITVNSVPQRPIVQNLPLHGVAVFQSSGTRSGASGGDILEYTPSTGYLGPDTFLLQSWTDVPYPRPIRIEYIINVGPSIVNAVGDYVSTAMGQTVLIDALANDSGTFGNLELSAITLVANGTAGIQSNQISFTPTPGFKGTAQVSYSVCDLLGVCDAASVNVIVYDPNPSSDTLFIQVPKNGERVLLIDDQGYPLTTPPSNGTLTLGMPKMYRANANFLGSDLIKWSETTNGVEYTKVVYIEVIDIQPANMFAVDDEIFISQNTTAYIDVKANDVQGSLLSGLGISVQPANGSTSVQNGVVIYTPLPNFYGTDELTYRIFPPGYSGPAEYATVTIIVSNLPPARFDFYLETPKNTPLVIEYPIPFSNYSFGIAAPGAQNGDAAFYPTIDSTIGGYPVLGNRILLYNPNSGFTGTDVFVANYCITTSGACVALNVHVNVLDLTPPAGGWCVQQCVWPGDTDNNGIVELADLLPIGRAHGAIGAARSSTSTFWTGLDAPPWSQQSSSAGDLKYIDADGNGIIGAADTSQILQNLGRYHMPFANTSARINPLPIFIELPFDTLYEGDLAFFSILLGTDNNYAEDVYGLTFDLGYNTSFIQEGSQSLSFDEDSWLNYATPSLNLVHEEQFGLVSSAFTLTEGSPRTGYGRVAKFEFIVDEDLLGIRPGFDSPMSPQADDKNQPEFVDYADFTISNASVSATKGERASLANTSIRVPVMRRPYDLAIRDRDLSVFPNPASGSTRIHLNGVDQIDLISVFNELGARVASFEIDGNDHTLDTSSFAKGIYFLEIQAQNKLLRRRLIVQ